jgi:hypothetical protein
MQQSQFKLAATFADAKARRSLSLNDTGASLYLLTARRYAMKGTNISYQCLIMSSDQFVDTRSVEFDGGFQPIAPPGQ